MDCPTCGEELLHEDIYGRLCAHQDGHIAGDIYRCENENCESFMEFFHTYRSNPDDLREGYPC